MTASATTPGLRARAEGILEKFFPDPVEALVEAIYSVLIVMTFTLGVSAFSAAHDAPGQELSPWMTYLFWEAFGSAAAWGIIDGFMYLTESLFARGDLIQRFRTLRAARNEVEGMELVAYEIEEMIEMIPDAGQREQVVRSVYRALLSGKPQHSPQFSFRQADLMGALGTFAVAVLAALPVALPLLLLQVQTPMGAHWIVRASNLVACVMLFVLGYWWSRLAGGTPWKVGLILAAAGLALMAITVPLGA